MASKKTTRIGPGRKIVVTGFDIELTRDDFKHGAVGPSSMVVSESTTLAFESFDALMKFMHDMHSVPENRDTWGAFEDGRLIAQYESDAEGLPLTAREESAWREGKGEAYVADVNVYILMTESSVPTVDEMADEFGIESAG